MYHMSMGLNNDHNTEKVLYINIFRFFVEDFLLFLVA